MMKTFVKCWITWWLGCTAQCALADVFVIVNANSAIKSLTNKEAVELFMGRTRVYPNGDYVVACDLPRDNPVRAVFYYGLTGMSQAQLNSYWSRLMFTGQVMPPQLVPNEQGVIDVIRRNPGAIGYVSQEPVDKGVRVVLVMRDTR